MPGSNRDIIKLLCAFGRVPLYLNHIDTNLTAFFFRSISKQNEIAKRTGRETVPDKLSGILGLQFENLLSNNAYYLMEKLHITDPLFVGGYFQTQTQRKQNTT